MALPVNGSTHLTPAYYSFYRPRKDERLSWPSWLTYSGRLTHISGHPSATGRAQDRESSPARDRRSNTVPRHQPGRISRRSLASENRVPGLSCGVVLVILRLAVLVELRLVTDTDTDRHGQRPMSSTERA